jgi:hypothetical protein
MIFSPSRDQVRQFFFDTWAKYRAGQPLAGAEHTAIEVILAHPEYHAILAAPERYLAREYLPEMGEINPFMHLAMHMAIREQLAIDQPAGIRERYRRLVACYGDDMNAQHEIMDCLAEMIWQAQREGAAYDPAAYLDCLDRKVG